MHDDGCYDGGLSEYLGTHCSLCIASRPHRASATDARDVTIARGLLMLLLLLSLLLLLLLMMMMISDAPTLTTGECAFVRVSLFLCVFNLSKVNEVVRVHVLH